MSVYYRAGVITDTVLLPELATSTWPARGFTATPRGPNTTVMVVVTVLVAPLITDAVPDPSLVM